MPMELISVSASDAMAAELQRISGGGSAAERLCCLRDAKMTAYERKHALTSSSPSPLCTNMLRHLRQNI